jgi:hypothetical protein
MSSSTASLPAGQGDGSAGPTVAGAGACVGRL